MENYSDILCCNTKQTGRIFFLPQQNCRLRYLVFLDRCSVCGQPIATIKQLSDKGVTKTVVRRAGSNAIMLFEKLRNTKQEQYKIKSGNKANMSWLWFDGKKDLWVRDFNNTPVFKVG